MSGFIPGPWYIDEGEKTYQGCVLITDGGCAVAHVEKYEDLPQADGGSYLLDPLGTARLIAHAPDLYKAGKVLFDAYESWNAREEGGEDYLHYAVKEFERILQAIDIAPKKGGR